MVRGCATQRAWWVAGLATMADARASRASQSRVHQCVLASCTTTARAGDAGLGALRGRSPALSRLLLCSRQDRAPAALPEPSGCGSAAARRLRRLLLGGSACRTDWRCARPHPTPPSACAAQAAQWVPIRLRLGQDVAGTHLHKGSCASAIRIRSASASIFRSPFDMQGQMLRGCRGITPSMWPLSPASQVQPVGVRLWPGEVVRRSGTKPAP